MKNYIMSEIFFIALMTKHVFKFSNEHKYSILIAIYVKFFFEIYLGLFNSTRVRHNLLCYRITSYESLFLQEVST